MSKINRLELTRTTLIGGALFLVPLVVLIMVPGKAVGLEIERLADGRSVVYIPSPPNTWTYL